MSSPNNSPLHHSKTNNPSSFSDDGKTHLLLAASGSVAIVKLPLIISALAHHTQPPHPHDSNQDPRASPCLSIRIILTQNAARFFKAQSRELPSLAVLRALPGVEAVYQDADEWAQPWTRGGEILHIELRRWAHLLVIAPLSANSLAKIAGGLADNLLMCVVRAWDTGGGSLALNGLGFGGDEGNNEEEVVVVVVKRGVKGSTASAPVAPRKRIIIAPAMNSAMWTHPVTAKHLKVLEEEWGVIHDDVNPTSTSSPSPAANPANAITETTPKGWIELLRPQVKKLACGDVGQGGMCDWEDIVALIEKRLHLGLGLGLGLASSGENHTTAGEGRRGEGGRKGGG